MYVVRIESDILCDAGSAALTANGRHALDLLFKEIIGQTDQPISLEGHTDDIPIIGHLANQFPTNWELSTARASAAARYLIDKGRAPDGIRAVGYADSKPVAENETEAGRAMNRRLEIYLLPPNEAFERLRQ